MPLVHIKTKKLEFRFELKGKYTLLKGDSGIGKTTFYNLVSDLDNPMSGIQKLSKMKIVAVPRNFENFTFEKFSNCIMVIDENCTLFNKKECAKILQNSNNYFILINRGLNFLPIHTESVYTIDCKNHFYTLKNIYSRNTDKNIQDIDTIIVEDSASGFSFVKDLFSCFDFKGNVKIETSKGESNIVPKIEELYLKGSKNFVIIYDAAAFAGSIDKLIECIKKYSHCSFFIADWDSFEHYILNSKFFDKKITIEDADCDYESLEQYSTFLLAQIFQGYRKDTLPSCFRRSRCKKCKQAGCYYRRMPYTYLIYSRLAVVYSFFNTKYDRVKVDFSYRKLYNHNSEQKEVKVPNFRIISVDMNNSIVEIENIKTKNRIQKSIIGLVKEIYKRKIYVSNLSELKDWSGWSGVLN